MGILEPCASVQTSPGRLVVPAMDAAAAIQQGFALAQMLPVHSPHCLPAFLGVDLPGSHAQQQSYAQGICLQVWTQLANHLQVAAGNRLQQVSTELANLNRDIAPLCAKKQQVVTAK